MHCSSYYTLPPTPIAIRRWWYRIRSMQRLLAQLIILVLILLVLTEHLSFYMPSLGLCGSQCHIMDQVVECGRGRRPCKSLVLHRINCIMVNQIVVLASWMETIINCTKCWKVVWPGLYIFTNFFRAGTWVWVLYFDCMSSLWYHGQCVVRGFNWWVWSHFRVNDNKLRMRTPSWEAPAL